MLQLDWEIITLLAELPTIEQKIGDAPASVRDFLREQLQSLLAQPGINDEIAGYFLPDHLSQEQVGPTLALMGRLASIK